MNWVRHGRSTTFEMGLTEIVLNNYIWWKCGGVKLLGHHAWLWLWCWQHEVDQFHWKWQCTVVNLPDGTTRNVANFTQKRQQMAVNQHNVNVNGKFWQSLALKNPDSHNNWQSWSLVKECNWWNIQPPCCHLPFSGEKIVMKEKISFQQLRPFLNFPLFRAGPPSISKTCQG